MTPKPKEPENCMVDLATNQLKIIDLGLSKHMQSARTLGIGTPDYMAPELVLRPPAPPPGTQVMTNHDLASSSLSGASTAYDAGAADVWSMGATLYLMVCGAYPFEDPKNPRDLASTLRNVALGKYRPLPPHLSPEAEHLLACMFQPDPALRITLAAIKSHAWCQPSSASSASA